MTRATDAEGVLTTSVTAANAAITAETGRAEGAETALGASIASTATTTLNTAEAFSANASNLSSGTVGQAFLPSDVVYNNQANAYTAGSKQTLGASTTTAASLNVPNTGDAPSTPNMGDVWLTGADAHLQFQDKSNTAQSLAFLSDVNASNASVATETARAEGAETTLTSNLSTETSRATTAEGTLTTNLTAETTRATGAETTLTNNLSSEVTRATDAEAVLTSSVTAANAAITAETGRAEGAEAEHWVSIASTATTTLNTAEAFSANASNLSSGTVAQTLLPTMWCTTTRPTVYAGSKQTLGASATTAASLNVPNTGDAPSTPNMGDVWLTAPMPPAVPGQEQHRAVAGVPERRERFECIGGDGRRRGPKAAESDADQQPVRRSDACAKGPTGTRPTNLNGEISRATGAETTLTNNLSSEVTRATGAETALGTSVTAANGAIAAETTRATTAEAALGTSVSTETSRAEGVEALKAKLDGGNAFTGGSQVLAPSTTTYSSMNVPVNGAAPSTPNMGDVWLTGADAHLQFQDKSNTAQSLAFLSDVNASMHRWRRRRRGPKAAETTLTSNLTAPSDACGRGRGHPTTNLTAETTRATGAETTLTN